MNEYRIVTHTFPDLDALCSVWLLKRFGSGHLADAQVCFVPHGQTWRASKADSDNHVIHVDTGGGKFDHHHTNDRTCASRLVYESLERKEAALEAMVEYVTAIDHFEDAAWSDALADRYDFGLPEIMEGLKVRGYSDQELCEIVLQALDGVYASLSAKIAAIELVKETGLKISTSKGEALAVQTFNDDVIRVGLKMGYVIVLRRDPLKHYVRIKAHPQSEVDLTGLYQHLVALDPEASWFLHEDKKQLINGTSADKERVVSELDFEVYVELLAQV